MPLVGKRVQLAWIRMRLVGVRVSICYLVHKQHGRSKKEGEMDGWRVGSLPPTKQKDDGFIIGKKGGTKRRFHDNFTDCRTSLLSSNLVCFTTLLCFA